MPELLNEIHRLIEGHSFKFVLSGSSARKLKSGGQTACRKSHYRVYVSIDRARIGCRFVLDNALKFGLLPEVWDGAPRQQYLESYVATYLKEEVQQEGLTRSIGTFSRFLEIASFSQYLKIYCWLSASRFFLNIQNVTSINDSNFSFLMLVCIELFDQKARLIRRNILMVPR